MDKAFSYWKANLGFRDSELSVNDFQNMIKTLMPTFNIVESVASTALESTKKLYSDDETTSIYIAFFYVSNQRLLFMALQVQVKLCLLLKRLKC